MKKAALLLAVAAAALLLLAGCGRKTAVKSADLAQVMARMKDAAANDEMMDLTADDLMPNYGIDAQDVKQFAVCVDSTGTKGDEIILTEGKDGGAADRIREKLELRYKQKQIEMKDYLPEEYAVLKQCSVRTDGNYVSLIVSPQHEELEKIYRDALGL